jgi:hypothetical protein
MLSYLPLAYLAILLCMCIKWLADWEFLTSKLWWEPTYFEPWYKKKPTDIQTIPWHQHHVMVHNVLAACSVCYLFHRLALTKVCHSQPFGMNMLPGHDATGINCPSHIHLICIVIAICTSDVPDPGSIFWLTSRCDTIWQDLGSPVSIDFGGLQFSWMASAGTVSLIIKKSFYFQYQLGIVSGITYGVLLF